MDGPISNPDVNRPTIAGRAVGMWLRLNGVALCALSAAIPWALISLMFPALLKGPDTGNAGDAGPAVLLLGPLVYGILAAVVVAAVGVAVFSTAAGVFLIRTGFRMVGGTPPTKLVALTMSVLTALFGLASGGLAVRFGALIAALACVIEILHIASTLYIWKSMRRVPVEQGSTVPAP